MRLPSLVRTVAFGLSLLGGSIAFADVAPPPDAGSTPDMTSTMAKPDMSTPVTTKDDGGCSMSGHSTPNNAAVLLFGASALGLAFASRRRRA